ncbi:hypothetical protein HG535_0G01050 [Zygotorulaspora mrakii]|uniref:Uncharacterized protein n=1 Tax=Zygotorulaspora mrakii TaxID=42260 RepID=A0A7H9B6C6_ZYGMR|nr:uncharacterized protein HG535_0G01050 [Zygotorulaspora mrakii]QLG74221.1 hypothetical protein HG535_0G01050 [Zygotorulaspora mrakii]
MNGLEVLSDSLEWPHESEIVRKRPKNYTLVYISKVFYNTGSILLTVFLIIKSIILPSLTSNYKQREVLSVSTIVGLRKLISSLQKRLKFTPVSALGFNEQNGTIERSTQTTDDTSDIIHNEMTRWKSLNEALQDATDHLQHFNTALKPSTFMNSFSFQTKLVADQLQQDRSSDQESDLCNKAVTSIRGVKGWFVNGRIA